LENILLIGTAGCGRSAFINTVHKALSGRYIMKAKCGFGECSSLTRTFQRFVQNDKII
jgi:predicted GTPase